jgi:hypothetical protein
VIDIFLVVSVKFRKLGFVLIVKMMLGICVHLPEVGCLTHLSVLTSDNFNEMYKN